MRKKRCRVTDCPIYSRREIPFNGNKKAKIVIMGESGGKQEENQGKQFVGDTGDFIKSRVMDAGLFGKIMWMNAARCRIDKNELSQKEITQILKNCRPTVEKVLKAVQPKVVFLMGGLALKQVLKKGGVKNNRGKWLWSDEFKCWCIATWHPGYIFRKKAFEPEFNQDFRKLVEFVENGYKPPRDDVELDYREVDSIQDVLDLAKNDNKIICGFDTEAQGLDWISSNFVPISYSISHKDHTAYHIQLYEEAQEDQDADFWIKWPRYAGNKRKKEPVDVPVRKAAFFDQKLKELHEFVTNPNICKVMQHGSFDQHVVDRLFTMNGVDRPKWESYIADIQAMAHLLDENLYVMANLTKLQYSFTNIREDYNSKFDSAYDKSDMLAVPREPLVFYAGADSDVTRQAFMGIWKELKKHPKLVKYYKQFVHPALTKIIYSLEHFGVAVDVEKLPDATAEVKGIRDRHQQEALKYVPKKVKEKHEAKGLSLTRRDIIRDALFSEDGYNFEPVKLTDSKQPSADKDSLKELLGKTKRKKVRALIEEYQQFSEYDMLWSRYLKGYAKHIKEDGRTHSSISITAAVTGRLGTKEPNNMAIPKRSKAAPIVRSLIIPKPGYVFVLIDQSQSELRLLAHYSNDLNMIRVFNEGGDIHANTAAEIVRMNGKRWRDLTDAEKKEARTKAKACIAEGQLVLTDKGLVEIENVTTDMKVWDGVEWVSHDGVVYNGIREVMTYDGLTATPDHEVYVSKWKAVQLWKAASSVGRQRLVTGGIKDLPIRHNDHPRKGVYEKGRAVCNLLLYRVQKIKRCICPKYQKEKDHHLSLYDNTKIQKRPSCKCTWRKVRCYGTALQKSVRSQLQKLWRTGDLFKISIQKPFYQLDVRKFATPNLPRGVYRPKRQQRPLHAGEFTIGYSKSKYMQYKKEHIRILQRAENSNSPCMAFNKNRHTGLSLQLGVDNLIIEKGNDYRRSFETEAGMHVRSKVYDILNAGPRHRFTVSGKIVSNCVFGAVYGITAPGLVRYAKSDYGMDISLQQAKNWLQALANKYPNIKKFQEKTIEFVKRNGYAESLLGRRRRLPEITSREDFLRWEAERHAVNFPIQSMSSDMVLMAGNTIIDKDFPEDEIRPVLFIHDELIFEVREDKVDEYVPHIVHAMENPPLEDFGVNLKVPLQAEPKIGVNASDTKPYESKLCN